jgi:anthraniloyl-CoA monooxygenase
MSSRSTPLRRVAVVGGGPGGAFFARLLRRASPATAVTLYDTLPPLATFGFGVGLSISTQNNLARNDPETFARIFGASVHGHGTRLVAATGSTVLPGNDQMAIARAELLRILYEQAAAAGVCVETGARVDAFELDVDLVVAADGVGSQTRQSRAGQFGAREHVGRQRYIWCGADRALPDALFAPAVTEYGTFVTHAYPYARDRSTFLVETSDATWRAAGFESTSQGLMPGETDETARAFLEQAFAAYLGGNLLGNNSRWTQFRTVSCARWSYGNVVLLGDAAHTAHYSIGSGTKLAMEDAIALARALAGSDTLPGAFAEYETVRKPSVARLQRLADRSQLWWEGYVRRLDMPPEQLMLSFVTRAGNVSVKSFHGRATALAEQALSQYAGQTPPRSSDLDRWVIDCPLRVGAREFRTRDARHAGLNLDRVLCDLPDPWAPEADELIERITASADVGVQLMGAPDRIALLQRLDVAERIVRETSLVVSVAGPGDLASDLAAGLVTGRTHLVLLSDDDAEPATAVSDPRETATSRASA